MLPESATSVCVLESALPPTALPLPCSELPELLVLGALCWPTTLPVPVWLLPESVTVVSNECDGSNESLTVLPPTALPVPWTSVVSGLNESVTCVLSSTWLLLSTEACPMSSPAAMLPCVATTLSSPKIV